MEKGFYHPSVGYWQTISDPCEATLAAYPEGTIEVPIKPGADYEWQDGEWVHVPPDPADRRAALPPLTIVQLMIGLVAEGWISEAEGDAWLDGTLPAAVEDLIVQLPPAEQFPARARAKRMSTAERLDPLVVMLGAAEGKTDLELDEFFEAWAQV